MCAVNQSIFLLDVYAQNVDFVCIGIFKEKYFFLRAQKSENSDSQTHIFQHTVCQIQNLINSQADCYPPDSSTSPKY